MSDSIIMITVNPMGLKRLIKDTFRVNKLMVKCVINDKSC